MLNQIFIVLFLVVFATTLGLGIISPLIPIYAEKLGAGGIWIGFIFSAFPIARSIAMPFIGNISDKHGRKVFIIFGLFIYTLLSIGYIWANDIPKLTWVRLLHGVASAMVVPIAMAYIGEISPKGEEGKYVGTFSISVFTGIGVGPLIGGFCNDYFGFSSVFLTMGVFSFIAFCLAVTYLPEQSNSIKNSKTNSDVSIWSVLKNNTVRGLIAYRIVLAMGRGVIISFLPILAQMRHLSGTQIGILISVNTLVVAVLQRFFGKIADQYNKMWMCISGGTISLVAIGLTPVAADFFQLLILGLLLGLGGAVAIPALSAMAVTRGKQLGMGTTLGLFTTAMSVGMMISPILAGSIVDVVNISACFYFQAFINLIGIFVFYLFLRKD